MDENDPVIMAAAPSVKLPILVGVCSLLGLVLVAVATYNVPGFSFIYQSALIVGVLFFGRAYLSPGRAVAEVLHQSSPLCCLR
jgi:hypothetical protein